MVGLSLAVAQLLFLVATVLGMVLAGVLWQNRTKPGATALLVANVGVSLWSASQLGSTVAVISLDNVQLGMMFNWILYPTVALTVVTAFVFALEYTGRERYVTSRTIGILALYPLAVAFVTVVNPDGVFYSDFSAAVEGVGQDVNHLKGPAYHAHTLVGYALILGVFGMILELLVRSGRPLYRGQAVALLLGIAAPVGLNVLRVTGLLPLDLTVIGFIATSGLFTVAILRYQLINVTPIAREKVIETVRDGMFVVDTDDTILDANPAFRRFIVEEGDAVVGTDARALFGEVPNVLDAYTALTSLPETDASEDDSTRERQVTYGDYHLNVQSTPIFDDRDRHVGWLFLVHDVTDLVQRERDLENQIEKLDQFAGIVSHDLRNPLNVARGYVQQVRATGDLENLEKTEDALERMETIIDEALALAREGEDVTELETVSLEQVSRDAWANVETDGAQVRVTDTQIRADGRRIQRLLENLFRNSLEHGVDGEEHRESDHVVTVDIEERETDRLTLSIADNGVGIPDDKMDRVFESGYTTNRDGTGLGLAIVEQIANAHGWTVEASHSDSGGAKFELRNVATPV